MVYTWSSKIIHDELVFHQRSFVKVLNLLRFCKIFVNEFFHYNLTNLSRIQYFPSSQDKCAVLILAEKTFHLQRGGRPPLDTDPCGLLHHHRDDRHHRSRQLCPPLLWGWHCLRYWGSGLLINQDDVGSWKELFSVSIIATILHAPIVSTTYCNF